ncbi:hypothetical protein K502DRAFT_326282 [Neoconidiobolus thromboides FSU 785]|nr:hypothetical protein K502DRAFT_326282 [Neoconidiobolus thromboides FSU 785]
MAFFKLYIYKLFSIYTLSYCMQAKKPKKVTISSYNLLNYLLFIAYCYCFKRRTYSKRD